jgi:hypothetical protein
MVEVAGLKPQTSLASLLSQALVALTIELDNEYEHRVPSFTSDFGGRGPTWLISTAMYANFLRFVPDDGIAMRDLTAQAGSPDVVHPAFHGMRRWGYVTYTPDIGASPRKKDADAIVRVTPAGGVARDAWAATIDALGARWGARGLDRLQRALIPVVTSIDRPLPEYFPIHGAELRFPPLASPVSREPDHLGLLGLVAQALMNITIDYDATAMLPLCVAQNLLRPFTDAPVLVRDLPSVTGVAKKAWDSALPLAERLGIWTVEPVARGRGKQVRLTDAAMAMRGGFPSSLSEGEAAWERRCSAPMAKLRAELEAFVGDGSTSAEMFKGIEAYPDGWRAQVAPIKTLPHHPVVSHRGGYPDGS